MNKLSVYYCPKCGRYAYVQQDSLISCSACSHEMKLLSVPCAEFMRLSPEKRNVLILDHILSEARQISRLSGSCSPAIKSWKNVWNTTVPAAAELFLLRHIPVCFF